MAEDTDLLPWVLGGLLALGAAATVVLADTDARVPPAAALAVPAPAAPISPNAAAAMRALESDLSPVAVSPNARPQLPPGHVWECEIGGQRVFSDTRCGAHAAVRQLSDLNLMDSQDAYPHRASRPYNPAPDHYEPPPPPSDAGSDAADTGYPLYEGSPVIVVRERGRRDHYPRRGSRPHPRAAHPSR